MIVQIVKLENRPLDIQLSSVLGICRKFGAVTITNIASGDSSIVQAFTQRYLKQGIVHNGEAIGQILYVGSSTLKAPQSTPIKAVSEVLPAFQGQRGKRVGQS